MTLASGEAAAETSDGQRARRITVMAPMRNEAEHVGALVASIAAQDFDGEIEFLVADGASTDDSVERLRAAAERYGVPVTILDNPERLVSHALNRCIRAASGDLLIRVDCHSGYPPDYVRRCVEASDETGAENVGGVFVPRGRTSTERAVACAMNGPFGGIHWTRNREDGRVEVDTTPYGAFRREAFERVGLFDESFVRNQDDEFNLRLRLAGGRVVLDPSIRVEYTPRGSWRGVFRQYFDYGYWKPAVMLKHRHVTSARSLAPAVFVALIIALVLLAPWLTPAFWPLVAVLASYAVAALVFGVASVRRCRASWRLLPRVVTVFPAFHFGHGLGFLVGAAPAALRTR